MSRRLMAVTGAVALVLILGGAGTAFAGAESEAGAAAPDVVELEWVGLGLGAGGGRLYPDPGCVACVALEEAVSALEPQAQVKLIPIETHFQSQDEMNLLFASGVIPDHWMVQQNHFPRHFEQGLMRDIPEELLRQYAPNIVEYMETYQPYWKQLHTYIDGKLYGVPDGQQKLHGFAAIRDDWLEAVGMAAPTTLDELREVLRAFTEEDPDGDGQANTWGAPGTISEDNLFRMVLWSYGIGHTGHGQPGREFPTGYWTVDASGELVNSVITENYRDALKYWQGLWDAGYLHPDVTAKNKGDFFADDQIGVMSIAFIIAIPAYTPSQWYANFVNSHPGVTTTWLEPFAAAPGYQRNIERMPALWMYHPVGRNSTDLELIKVLQVLDIQLADMRINDIVWAGLENEHFVFDEHGMRVFTEYAESPEVRGKEVGVKFFLLNSRNRPEHLRASWGKDSPFFFSWQEEWGQHLPHLGFGVTLQSRLDYGTDIDTIRDEFTARAMTGQADIDGEWDTYVNNWLNSGGRQVTAEAQQLYASRQ